jgi:hypothetical protein
MIHSTPLPPPTAAGRIGPPIPLAPPPRAAATSVVGARPVTRPAPYAAPPATPAEAIARIARGAPVDPSVPMVASALGMARTTMAAPSSVSPANAASLYRQTGSGDE